VQHLQLRSRALGSALQLSPVHAVLLGGFVFE
jgi:hypothetical protein